MQTSEQPALSTTAEPSFLSREDVERLMEDKSIESRIDVVQKISGQYVGKVFTDTELRYAEQIFRLLVKDTESRVRLALARSLKDAEDAPRDVITTLAHDEEKIAAPIISYSDVLSDADLMRIIENSHEVGKIEAVAKRSGVSERVSSALISTHYPQVVQTLLENDSARIAEKDYNRIIDDHADNQAVTEAMAKRAGLPLAVVEKVIHHVSDALAEQLKSDYQIDAESAADQARESMTLQLVSPQASDADILATLNQMKQAGRLSASIVISALCQGNLRFFEMALAELAGIPAANARKLVRDKGQLGFKALYEKTGMPQSMFQPVRLLLNVIIALERDATLTPGTPLYANAVIEQLLAQPNADSLDNLPYMIALVRQSITH